MTCLIVEVKKNYKAEGKEEAENFHSIIIFIQETQIKMVKFNDDFMNLQEENLLK